MASHSDIRLRYRYRGCLKSTRQPPRQMTERFRVSGSVPTAPAMPVRRLASRARIQLEYANRPSPAARHAVLSRCVTARRAKPSRSRRCRTWQTSAGRHSCTWPAIRGHRVAFADGAGTAAMLVRRTTVSSLPCFWDNLLSSTAANPHPCHPAHPLFSHLRPPSLPSVGGIRSPAWC